MTDFYREADGLLTGNQIKAIRDDLGLTQAEAAKVFGGGKNAFTKYENGDVTQSVAMDKLIRTAYAVPAALDFLRKGCPSVVTVEYNPLSIRNLSEISTYLVSTRFVKSPSRNEKSDTVKIAKFTSEPVSRTVNWQVIAEHMAGSKL
jgi:HTH-type transcriptional regulator/antitoxin MqsA